MISFEDVMRLTGTISGNAAFEDVECRAYYDLIVGLAPGSTILEIGLQFGRSSSIALQVAAAKFHTYWGCDSFTEPPEAEAAWQDMKFRVNYPAWVLKGRSGDIHPTSWPNSIDLALIDGDHECEGVKTDLGIVLPRISAGGYVCLHDYGRDSLPGVFQAVSEAMPGQPFDHVGTYGTLGVWKRA